MRYYQFKATILFVGLISLASVLTLLFLSREKFIGYEHHSTHDYQQYLTDKIALINHTTLSAEQQCQKVKHSEIHIVLPYSVYQFYCEKLPFFIGKPPSKKTVIFERISDYLRLDETIPIMQVKALADLPPTSLTEPKIVILLQDIDEKLPRDFYGILITQHRFNLKNGAKMYGVLYTSQEENKNNRYITYRREVVKYFDEQYSTWHFLPYSRNLLNAK